MKIMTVLGTRPEIIRLSLIIARLDQFADQHVLVHTGQNSDPRLSQLFFDELGVRTPDRFLEVAAPTAMGQVGQILERIEGVLEEERPDRLLILGDTNSGLAAIPARRMGIPVYHMEAGNRCFDDRVPEEVNRRIIDHSSTVLMPYTPNSRENLLAEGFAANRVYVTGNPIGEVIDHHTSRTASSTVLTDLGLSIQSYFLVTMHRAENVDVESRLRGLVMALRALAEVHQMPVIASFHPRTRARVEKFGVELAGLRFLEPFGFFDFLKLEQEAFCVLSDSGTVQEEACLFGTPNVTIRDVTERPETLECGSNVLAGADSSAIGGMVRMVTAGRGGWTPPPSYLQKNVADTVVRLLLSSRLPDEAERQYRSTKA
ncbi:MAG: UDP-N-acetylglucosamine 2-epimerase (non-hydrolyzing) [Armatimonadota bacterium]